MPRKTPVLREEKTLSRTEVQWLVNLINRQLEELESVLIEPETTALEHGIAELMKENYAHVRDKLAATLEYNWTRIYVKQPDIHPFRRSAT